ncbi:AlpA family phage regulatory protein [Caballeronia sp. LZ035]|uniref:helix-turn-helix transcriptional regulator n=1 Tax=Caballeronia sp. LZ035 TaxID=3038568 RepID=UPI002865F92A|nr:AlpA family phage regulatory protein [Caballeronia sp. LZ035]MDR5758209.1 AlpA family phage regulatory protein [Caballeronia sp. LZ035]
MSFYMVRRKQLAEMLSVSLSTIDKWQAKGLIASPIKIGPNSVAWRSEYIEAFIAQREAQARDFSGESQS